jgi:hypothetical protein
MGRSATHGVLQTVLRREPDVVLVDQCEDRETAQLACRAAAEKKIYMTVRAPSSDRRGRPPSGAGRKIPQLLIAGALVRGGGSAPGACAL